MIVFAVSSEAYFHETSIRSFPTTCSFPLLGTWLGCVQFGSLPSHVHLGLSGTEFDRKQSTGGKGIFKSLFSHQKFKTKNLTCKMKTLTVLLCHSSLMANPGIPPSLSPPKDQLGKEDISCGQKKSSQPEGPQSCTLAKSGLADLQTFLFVITQLHSRFFLTRPLLCVGISLITYYIMHCINKFYFKLFSW